MKPLIDAEWLQANGFVASMEEGTGPWWVRWVDDTRIVAIPTSCCTFIIGLDTMDRDVVGVLETLALSGFH